MISKSYYWLAGILLIVLITGCRTNSVVNTPAPVSVSSIPDTVENRPYVELTYPQSDDQGYYTALPKTGEVTVSGIIAALQQPKGVVVNGVPVQPYLVQDITPFNTPTGYNTYGFDLPMEITPATLLNIVLQEAGINTPAVTFTPNESVYSRLLSLATASPQSSIAQYRLGNALLTQQNYNDALTAYNRSLEIQPEFVWAYNGLGQTYLQMQRPAEAELQFKKAKKLRPKWVSPYYRLAEMYNSQGQYDYAIVEYRKALQLVPIHPGLHRGYAVALYNKGYYQEAWNQVHLTEKYGVKPSVDFIKRLHERLPEPPKDGKARGNEIKQTGQDQKRQDGIRRSGPHVLDTNAKAQQNKSQLNEDKLHKDKPRINDSNTQRNNRKQDQRQDKLQQPGLHNTSGQTNKHSEGK